MANLTLRGINTKQIGDRRQLLTTIDNMKRDIDAGGQIAGADHLTERALGVLTSSKLVDALDLSKNPIKSVPVTAPANPTSSNTMAHPPSTNIFSWPGG